MNVYIYNCVTLQKYLELVILYPNKWHARKKQENVSWYIIPSFIYMCKLKLVFKQLAILIDFMKANTTAHPPS